MTKLEWKERSSKNISRPAWIQHRQCVPRRSTPSFGRETLQLFIAKLNIDAEHGTSFPLTGRQSINHSNTLSLRGVIMKSVTKFKNDLWQCLA
mmetsp:Transcript_17609/g.36638  ORF Transcript_17609/g.36638 Transcript_17609/m.36638 type:complete len:93 (-) Transcript_17609:170-448(-)